MVTATDIGNSHITEHEYLEGEKLADTRHEYVGGRVYEMAGAGKHHNTIALNLAIALRAGSQGTSCEIYTSDIKVRINERKSYYYPDVVVSCDESDNADEYYLEKPCLIIEVLSPSTERRDGTEKLIAYQDIDSLQAYMMVDQDKCFISLIYKQVDEHWQVDYYDEPDALIPITCPPIELRVSDVYENITF